MVNLLDIADDGGLADALNDYRYPPPDVRASGGIPNAQARKIAQAQRDAGDTRRSTCLSHGYGPLEDYRARTEVAWQAAEHGMWVNRYAYLH